MNKDFIKKRIQYITKELMELNKQYKEIEDSISNINTLFSITNKISENISTLDTLIKLNCANFEDEKVNLLLNHWEEQNIAGWSIINVSDLIGENVINKLEQEDKDKINFDSDGTLSMIGFSKFNDLIEEEINEFSNIIEGIGGTSTRFISDIDSDILEKNNSSSEEKHAIMNDICTKYNLDMDLDTFQLAYKFSI